MPTRDIIYLQDGRIKKIVPSFDCLRGKKFPELGEVNRWDDDVKEEIYELINGTSLLCQSAVVQQYNEYIIARQALGFSVLAPLQFISTDERGIPILGFPYFTPLASNEDFYKYTDEECLIELGMAAAKHSLNFNDVRAFINQVKDLCIEFDLREDDILGNLSNIGYNKEYGLRVIDFGLVSGSTDRKFELVI